MKKIHLLLVLFLSFWSCAMQAQNKVENDVITVTDSLGNKQDIDIPEGMFVDVDSLLHLYNSRTYLQPDTSCNYKDVNPIYDEDVYINRLKRLPTIIEMPYNEVVQKFIDHYSNDLRRSVSYMLGAQNFYIPIFEQALEAYNLPLELKYLPVIESALNPNAVSRVGATGLWQFMIGTGKRYGLQVNSLVDERRDPIKASYAAAHYLSDLYKIFDDWNLVIAAYNCGPDKVNKAIHRAKGDADYWNIYPYLPKETRGYVPAFIAANYIMNYYCEHNICPMLTSLPAKTDTIVVNKDVHFDQIAAILGIDKDLLAELNPQYRHEYINGFSSPATVRLPSSLIGTFIDREDSIYNYKADEYLMKRTIVEVNHEAPSYSRRNSHKKNTKPSNRISQDTKKKKKKDKKEKKQQSVTIKSGDTLSEIAERNHTTVKKLKKLNGIKGNGIRSGKKIRIK